MANEGKSNAWEWAVANNCAIPFLKAPTNASLVIDLPNVVKILTSKYVRFAAHECSKREVTGIVPPEWTTVCESRSSLACHYSPRWTSPIFYFRGEFIGLFEHQLGLDVGARVSDITSFFKRGLAHPGLHNALLIESLIPHFKYYSSLGSMMMAIDLNAPDSVQKEIEMGDVRLLTFASSSFDFVTIPMLLGHNNPCSTYLEVALCLAELRRVLRPGGFVYIADGGFQPCVGFAAQCLNFDLFVSKGSLNGLPVGTMLRKPNLENQSSTFDKIFASLDIIPLLFNHSCDEVVLNCNLLFDTNKVVIRRKWDE